MPRRRAAHDQGDADPDFLALSERQRARIDGAFEKGVDRASGRKRKRTRRVQDQAGPSKAPRVEPEITEEDAGAGGFEDPGDGGFLMDDQDDGGGGGGFMAEEGDGGFLPDEDTAEVQDQATGPSSTRSTTPMDTAARIPLRLIPALLQCIGLPYDDDVLNVFKASASGWDDDDDGDTFGARGKKRGEDTEVGVERKDFRAVCAALMGDDEDPDGDLEMDDSLPQGADPPNREDTGGGFFNSDMDDDEDEDAYRDDGDSTMSSLSSDSEFGASRPKRAVPGSKGKGKARAGDTDSEAGGRRQRRKTKKDVLRETGPIKLSGKQREVVQDIWNMFKPPIAAQGRNKAGNILGRDEVKAWARSLGEMWTEDEITEMVTLFSSQHEQRGLSFDDFGAIMVRAGLA